MKLHRVTLRVALTLVLLVFCLFTSVRGLNQQAEEKNLQNVREEDPLIETVLPVSKTNIFPDDALLLVFTLDGGVIAVNKRTGNVKWRLQQEPIVKLPIEITKMLNPVFLPDPKDGTLYMIGSTGTEALTKLPFTIPELVAASPSKSMDGMFYMGKKLDMWFAIDPQTGMKTEVLSFDNAETVCPRSGPITPSIFIGRTEYSLSLFDSRTRERKWNVTYFDYSSSSLGTQLLEDYDLAHFSASSSGKVLTLDRISGDLLWQKDFLSPVVAMYGITQDPLVPSGAFSTVQLPFTVLAAETLTNLATKLRESSEQARLITGDTKLFPTLYVGKHSHGLYALPSLVDEQTATLGASQTGRLLIEGPPSDDEVAEPTSESNKLLGVNVQLPADLKVQWIDKYSSLSGGNSETTRKPLRMIFGQHLLSEYYESRIDPALRISQSRPDPSKAKQVPKDEQKEKMEPNLDKKDQFASVLLKIAPFAGFIVAVVVIIGTCRYTGKFLHSGLWEEIHSYTSSKSSSLRTSSGGTYTPVVELPSGLVQVGKILLNPSDILGKGCEGTFVYRGKFDNREVAVKRLLPECFDVADREVTLLRESDAHPNVVRYFCTEQDRQFRYIALELCAATLHDLVEKKYQGPPVDKLVLLRQATAGLAHLHSLDIVHRDIKPHNVLISMPSSKGEVRAMISDFGLCKKLKIGRMSFSRRSGVAGTEGWIAPEMLEDATRRTTCAVDVFSLGLVYYYVLTDGRHPFGDVLRRQANIMSGEHNLEPLENNIEGYHLVEKMLSIEPLERPPSKALLKHPLFWPKEKTLAFFQDVSDRVEKETSDSAVLQSLERCSREIVRGNWRHHVEEAVLNDLRRFRTYQGGSVRDLLRALRNKKHHYREMNDEIRRIMGSTPEEFCDYWVTRFPKLLLHSWYAMHCVKTEHIFARYYDKNYDFIPKLSTWSLSKVKLGFGKPVFPRPGFEPTFLNTAALLKKRSTDEEEEEERRGEDLKKQQENVPDSWDDVPYTEAGPELDAAALDEPNQVPEGSKEDSTEKIVLGPGGMWGRFISPLSQLPLNRTSDAQTETAGKPSPWTLPNTSQPWKFSEVEALGRKKKKKKKKNLNDGE